MQLTRLPYRPAALIDFVEEALTRQGALCERTWHDRLHVLAEGPAARLWQANGDLVEKEIHFTDPEDAAPRQADHEVFPGCPLLFRLCEELNPRSLTLQRAVVALSDQNQTPEHDLAERSWRRQFPATAHWQLASGFAPDWAFSLVALVRCEIQAMDQHWSLHRLTLSLPGGEPDEALGPNLEFLTLDSTGAQAVPWSETNMNAWRGLLLEACGQELAGTLAKVRERQENYLRRELARVDDYFLNYEKELRERLARTRSEDAKSRFQDRLKAAEAEHVCRRHDQVQRHEIRVALHLDQLVLLAEPAWRAAVATNQHGPLAPIAARFVPRTRAWQILDSTATR
jgi:hypothetical protein